MTGHASKMHLRIPRRTGIARLSAAAAALTLAACAGAPVHEPTEPRLTNTVTWSTASESDNFGFDIHRAEQRDGPYERITPQPVLGAGTTDLPRDYRFEDRDIEAGKAYYYYVESISLGGKRKRFTPVMQAPAKQPPGAAAGNRSGPEKR